MDASTASREVGRSTWIDLRTYGWTDAWASAHASEAAGGRSASRVPARVLAEDRGSYQLVSSAGELRGSISGRFRFDADDDPAAYPAVGDWVLVEADLVDETVIHAVLPRRSALIRQAAGGRTQAQVIGANLDVVFVVASLNGELNLRRLERYIAAAWESGAEPVVVLTKADLAPETAIDGTLAAVGAVAAGVPTFAVSAVDGRGLDDVAARIGGGRTVAFVGSSGVGKSTLLNRIAGADIALTQAIREDDARGRHTTTRRQLHLIPGGGLILDTPGMRELALWDADGLERSFADIESAAAGCRFRDCGHVAEPGCAVRAAIASGRLDADRLAAWRKLEREAAHQERRVDALARAEERRKWKAIGKSVGRHMDAKYGADTWR